MSSVRVWQRWSAALVWQDYSGLVPCSSSAFHASVQCAAPSSLNPSFMPRLHEHALQSVFVFSSLVDLHTACAVHRDWRLTVQRMPPASLTVAALSGSALKMMRSVSDSSAVLRHVGSLGTSSRPLELCKADLDALTALCPGLHSLSVSVCQLTAAHLSNAIAVPSGLRTLFLRIRVTVEGRPPSAAVQGAIRTIGALPLLEELRFIYSCVDNTISLVPLQQLSKLRLLEINSEFDTSLHSPHLEQVAPLLPQLLHVRLGSEFHCSELPRLLGRADTAGITLPCTSFNTLVHVDEHFALLAHTMPALRFMRLYVNASSPLEPLGGFTALRTLSLAFWSRVYIRDQKSAQTAAWERLVRAATSGALKSLTALHVSYATHVSCDSMTTLLASMPRLSLLWVSRVRFQSLRFLSSDALRSTLQVLKLESCELGSADYLLQMRSLRHLELFQCFDAPLSDDALRDLQPSSGRLPRLQRFICLTRHADTVRSEDCLSSADFERFEA